jgi:hypothetical protein
LRAKLSAAASWQCSPGHAGKIRAIRNSRYLA